MIFLKFLKNIFTPIYKKKYFSINQAKFFLIKKYFSFIKFFIKK
jgi:hypothetical protein